MGTIGFGRVKHGNGRSRVHAGADPDPALLKTMPRSAAAARPIENDPAVVRQALLLHLALKALDRAIAEYCGGTGRRRPSYAALARYLDEREHRGG
jgi:hypothetical protein